MAPLLRVDRGRRVAELDAITENRVHFPVKGHERVLEKLLVVKEYMHTVGRHVDRGRAKDGRRGSGHEGGAHARTGLTWNEG